MIVVLPFAVLISFCVSTFAHAITIPELKEKILVAYGALTSVQFEFEQEASSDLVSERRNSQGVLYFKKPNFLKVEQKSPESQFVFADGKSVTVYTPRFKQAIVDSWEDWVEGNLLLLCLSGSEGPLQRIREEFDWSIEQEEAAGWVVKLTPVNDKIGIGPVRLWVETDFLLRKAAWRQNGTDLETRISHLVTNPSLDANLFKFKKDRETRIFKAP